MYYTTISCESIYRSLHLLEHGCIAGMIDKHDAGTVYEFIFFFYRKIICDRKYLIVGHQHPLKSSGGRHPAPTECTGTRSLKEDRSGTRFMFMGTLWK